MDSPFQKAGALAESKETGIRKPASESAMLAAGGVAAFLASACCLVPLALVLMGFGGAWLATFKVLEPFRPVFIGAALVALFFAYRRIFRPAAACQPGEVCALPSTRRTYKAVFWVVVGLVGVAITFPYVAPLFY